MKHHIFLITIIFGIIILACGDIGNGVTFKEETAQSKETGVTFKEEAPQSKESGVTFREEAPQSKETGITF